MTQYPQPLGQPTYPAPNYPPPWPGSDPTGPAKRAAILMIILGVIGLLLAGCFGLLGAFYPSMKNDPELARALEKAMTENGLEADMLLMVVIVSAVLLGVWALGQIILGVLVRRGTAVPIVFALVWTGLSLLLLAFNAVGNLSMGNIPGFGCGMLTVGLAVLQLIFLIQAIRNASQVAAMQQMYGWQQQMAMGGMYPPGYGQPQQYGYGYGYGQMPQQQPQMPPQPPQQQQQQQQWPPPNGGANQ